MGPLDLLTAPLRSLLGVSEREEAELMQRSPIGATRELEEKLGETVAAMCRAADSMERHITVLETLADSLPALTESVTRLTDELSTVLRVTAPVAVAEREASKIEQLFFGRGRRGAPPPASG